MTDLPSDPPALDPAMAEAPVVVESLTARYGARTVFVNVSLEIRTGEVFVILGGSGSGKSTLLKHMIGLQRPAKGRVLIEGRDLFAADEIERRAILTRIGVLYQRGALFGTMTALENVALPLTEFTDLPPTAVDAVARRKLALVGLEAAADRHPAELSGGMLKRVGLARAMALDPAILFLDEPSAGLDPITSAELDDLIKQLNRTIGVTFVIVTHELASIFAIADRVLMLNHGKVAAIGDPHVLAETSDDPWVRQFFGRRAAPVSEAAR